MYLDLAILRYSRKTGILHLAFFVKTGWRGLYMSLRHFTPAHIDSTFYVEFENDRNSRIWTSQYWDIAEKRQLFTLRCLEKRDYEAFICLWYISHRFTSLLNLMTIIIPLWIILKLHFNHELCQFYHSNLRPQLSIFLGFCQISFKTVSNVIKLNIDQ
jgi:hypothetical protein